MSCNHWIDDEDNKLGGFCSIYDRNCTGTRDNDCYDIEEAEGEEKKGESMKLKKGAIYIHKNHKWRTKITKLTKTDVEFTYGGGRIWTPKRSFEESFIVDGKKEGE